MTYDPYKIKERHLKERELLGEEHISEKEGALFIEALKSHGWRIDEDFIFSPSRGLNFPIPEGWLTKFEDLEEIMNRKLNDFKDPDQLSWMPQEEQKQFIREHEEVLKSVDHAKSGSSNQAS